MSVVRTSSGDQAALYIRRSIFDGMFHPGERLPQDDIAAALGMSRIPIREALIALEGEGWVTIEIHKGAYVNSFDAGWVRDNYELFGLLYGLAARRALEVDVSFIPTFVSARSAFAKAKDYRELGRLAAKLNATIVDASHSGRIKIALRAMSVLVPGVFYELVPGAVPVQRRGFQAIQRALQAEDPDGVAGAYLQMMRDVADQVAKVFDERGLFAAAANLGE